MKQLVFSLMCSTVIAQALLDGSFLLAAAAERVVPVGGMADGERFSVVRMDSNGVMRTAGAFHVEKTIRSLLDAPIGSTYAPDGKDFDALKSASKPEILVRVPAWQTASVPQYWKRPRAVLLKRGSLEAIGFFSASREFATRRAAMDYLADQVGDELRKHVGADPALYPRGKAEFSYPYKRGDRNLEVRFKCFAVDGGDRSVILCYHGLSRGEKSMEAEFRAFYGFVTE